MSEHKEQTMNIKYYGVADVAKILGYSKQQVYNYVKDGRLTASRPGGGKILITQKDLDAFIERGRNEQRLVLAAQIQAKD